jgi:hypothetical protein
LTRDDNIVSFFARAGGISKKLLKFGIFYNDTDQYPHSSGIVTLEDCNGFKGVADEATVCMNSNADIPSLFRWLCGRLKIPLVIEPNDSISKARKHSASDESEPALMTRNNSMESAFSADSWISEHEMPGSFSVGMPDHASASHRAALDLEEVRRHGYGGGILPNPHFLPHFLPWLSLDIALLRLHPETAAAWRIDPAAMPHRGWPARPIRGSLSGTHALSEHAGLVWCGGILVWRGEGDPRGGLRAVLAGLRA